MSRTGSQPQLLIPVEPGPQQKLHKPLHHNHARRLFKHLADGQRLPQDFEVKLHPRRRKEMKDKPGYKMAPQQINKGSSFQKDGRPNQYARFTDDKQHGCPQKSACFRGQARNRTVARVLVPEYGFMVQGWPPRCRAVLRPTPITDFLQAIKTFW